MEPKQKRLPFSWLFQWKIWRTVLLLMAGLITAYALFCAEENFRGKHAWESYKAEMEAKGEVLDFTKFVPPPVPDDQNFAATPFFAQLFDFLPGTQTIRDSNTWSRVNKVSLIIPDNAREELDGKWQSSKPLDLVALANELLITNRHAKEPPRFKPEQTTEAGQTVMSQIEPVMGIIEELRKASPRPYSRFNVDYDWEPKYSIILPHLAPVHMSCEVLELRSCTELQTGDTAAAFEDVKLMFHLVQSLRTEPILISQVVRARCLGEMLQPIWEGLARRQWSDEQLTGFIKEFRSIDLMSDGIHCLSAEQCFSDTFFARLRRTWNPMQEINDIVGDFQNQTGPNGGAILLGTLGPRGWYYFEQLNYHRLYDYGQVNVIEPNRIDPSLASQRQEEVIGQQHSDVSLILRHRFLAKFFLPALVPFEFKMTRAQTWANLASIACGLERYRLAHNEYPENLAALTPQYLAAIPNDLIMDQPLKYRRESDGSFTLYSVGWNKKDDGGIPAKKSADNQEGDWVWKYPAQAAPK